MTDKITEPVPPSDLDPMPAPVLAGDWTDDDGSLVDAEFEAADHGPVKHTGVPHAVPEIKPTTRIVANLARVGTVNGAIVEPIMLLPADPNRINCVIRIFAVTVFCVISDSRTGCYNGDNWLGLAAAPELTLNGHTGPIWIYSTAASTVTASVIAVTV